MDYSQSFPLSYPQFFHNYLYLCHRNEETTYDRDESPVCRRVQTGRETTLDSPPSAEIHKTALGAEDSVNWKYFKNALEAVEALKSDGYEVYSVEQAHGSTMLHGFTPIQNKKYAVILGNEVKGVHQEVVDASDGCLEIPQFGTKHSMNVSVTAGIIIWHFAQTIIHV